MIYHFRAISSESDDFIMDIAIDSKARFIDLHNFLQQQLTFDKAQMTSFFITDDEWSKEKEITLIDMMEGEGPLVMDSTVIEELITTKKQRLLYAFDLFSERVLFMELIQIDKGDLKNPVTTKKEGTPPPQVSDINNMADIDINSIFENLNDDDDFLSLDEEFPEDLPDEDFNPEDYY